MIEVHFKNGDTIFLEGSLESLPGAYKIEDSASTYVFEREALNYIKMKTEAPASPTRGLSLGQSGTLTLKNQYQTKATIVSIMGEHIEVDVGTPNAAEQHVVKFAVKDIESFS